MDRSEGEDNSDEVTRGNHRPKRREVGVSNGVKIYQLDESTNCLDCFKSMPSGALICFEKVAGPHPVPRCLRNAKVDMSKIELTGAVEKCRELTCPGVLEPHRVDAYMKTLKTRMATSV